MWLLFRAYWQERQEALRLRHNAESIRKQDSLRYARQELSRREIEEYITYNRKDMEAFLKENRVAMRRIEGIITQQLRYRDTVKKEVSLRPVLDAIREHRRQQVPVVDSTACLVVKGYVLFDRDTLSLTITERVFNNQSDVVSYWERNQWRFLGIKTRLFGRKKATILIKDTCGQTKTFIIEKKK